MDNTQKKEFLEIVSATAELYSKNIKQVPALGKMYWNIFAKFSLEDIKQAIEKHICDPERGQYFPKPADIIHQLPKMKDFWPGDNEAWAMCPKNESESAAVCDEIMQAFAIANELLKDGDKIAARMSFKDTYTRLVDKARKEGRQPSWWVSNGTSETGRHEAYMKALELNQGNVTDDERKDLPYSPESQMLTYDDLIKASKEQKEGVHEKIQELIKKLGGLKKSKK